MGHRHVGDVNWLVQVAFGTGWEKVCYALLVVFQLPFVFASPVGQFCPSTSEDIKARVIMTVFISDKHEKILYKKYLKIF